MKRYPYFIAACCLLSSCFSKMTVTVDSLNMEAFRATYLFAKENVYKTERQASGVLTSDIEEKVNQYVRSVSAFIDSSGEVDVDEKKEYKLALQQDADTVLLNLNTSAMALLSTARDLSTGSKAVTTTTYEQSLGSFYASVAGLERMRVRFKQVNNNLAPDGSAVLNMLFRRVSSSIESVQSAFGNSVVSDPLASVIAALPGYYWRKYDASTNLSNSAGQLNSSTIGDPGKYTNKQPNRFNTTVARTFFGNSDIAIKMNTPGEFVVKGVRVDADEAIRNSFKVLSQGVKYLAYSAGVPMVENGKMSKKNVLPLLDSLEQNNFAYKMLKETAENATKAFVDMLNEVAGDINNPMPRNGKTAAQVKQEALQRIQNAYALYKNAMDKQQ